jgi:hypothetical protein
MRNSSRFQAMMMAPEPLEPCTPVASADESANVATDEPIPKKTPIEVAKTNFFFFFISVYSF